MIDKQYTKTKNCKNQDKDGDGDVLAFKNTLMKKNNKFEGK